MNHFTLVSVITFTTIGGLVASQSSGVLIPQQRGEQSDVIKPEMSDTITATVYADSWFAMYINGKFVAIHPIDFLPHNVVKFDVLPEYPMTIAIVAKDNAEPRTGYEYGNRVGDAALLSSFRMERSAMRTGKCIGFRASPVKIVPFPSG